MHVRTGHEIASFDAALDGRGSQDWALLLGRHSFWPANRVFRPNPEHMTHICVCIYIYIYIYIYI